MILSEYHNTHKNRVTKREVMSRGDTFGAKESKGHIPENPTTVKKRQHLSFDTCKNFYLPFSKFVTLTTQYPVSIKLKYFIWFIKRVHQYGYI